METYFIFFLIGGLALIGVSAYCLVLRSQKQDLKKSLIFFELMFEFDDKTPALAIQKVLEKTETMTLFQIKALASHAGRKIVEIILRSEDFISALTPLSDVTNLAYRNNTLCGDSERNKLAQAIFDYVVVRTGKHLVVLLDKEISREKASYQKLFDMHAGIRLQSVKPTVRLTWPQVFSIFVQYHQNEFQRFERLLKETMLSVTTNDLDQAKLDQDFNLVMNVYRREFIHDSDRVKSEEALDLFYKDAASIAANPDSNEAQKTKAIETLQKFMEMKFFPNSTKVISLGDEKKERVA